MKLYAKNTIDERVRDEYEENVLMLASDERELLKRNERDLLDAIENGYFEFEYKAAGR